VIETLDDIVEEVANGLGIYGACPPDSEECALCRCRCCYTAALTARIRAAVRVEDALRRGTVLTNEGAV
jgi:hypothetical protein